MESDIGNVLRKELTNDEAKRLDDMRIWIAKAEPCTKRVYYTGDLAVDACANCFADEMRALTWKAFQNGLISLTQRRSNTEGVFSYIAAKRAPPMANTIGLR